LWYQQNNSDAVDSAAVSLEVWLMLYTFPFCKGKRRENTIITERGMEPTCLACKWR
jgi:hypothetical protein